MSRFYRDESLPGPLQCSLINSSLEKKVYYRRRSTSRNSMNSSRGPHHSPSAGIKVTLEKRKPAPPRK